MQLTQSHINILNGRICPYCGSKPEYVDSSVIYGTSYGMVYLCKPCDAYVGVHKGTDTPLGRLSNAELREWKKKAHEHFDPIWNGGFFKRKEAYEMLRVHLGIPKGYCHIGMFSVETCKKVVEWAQGMASKPKPPKGKKKPAIRTRPANRFNNQREHNQYGVYNWFKRKGITNKEDIIGCVTLFCQMNNANTDITAMFNFVQNRFGQFVKFAIEYIGKKPPTNQ